MTTWDTANVYSSGIGEEIIGKALKKHDIPRSKVTICTKVMGTVPDEPGIFSWFYEGQMAQSKDYQNKGGKSTSSNDYRCKILIAVKAFPVARSSELLMTA